MSLGGWVLSIFATLLFLLLFVPFFFAVDSERKTFYIRWLLFTVLIDLSTKTTVIGFAGIRHVKREKKTTPAAPAAPSAPSGEAPGKKRSFLSLLSVALSRRALVIDLLKKSLRYFIDLLRSFSVRELVVDYSSKDPVVDGICYGAIQGIRIKRVDLSVNFWGETRVVGRFSLMLARLIIPTFLFLVRLPYIELYRLYKEIRRKETPEGMEGASAPS